MNSVKTTPSIHGGRPEDYFFTLGKTGTKTFHSIILDCKIPKGEIDSRFISQIQEKPEVEKYKDITVILEKRKKLNIKIDALTNQVAALNDQLFNLGIYNEESEKEALVKLEERTKQKLERRHEFDLERQDALKGTFNSNGWYYHGYSTGANPGHHDKNLKSPNIKSNYRPKPGNFNYDDDSIEDSDSRYTHNDRKPEPCESKFYVATPRILLENSITTRKEWLIWLRDNHVDKGGDSNKCSDIISAGRDRGW